MWGGHESIQSFRHQRLYRSSGFNNNLPSVIDISVVGPFLFGSDLLLYEGLCILSLYKCNIKWMQSFNFGIFMYIDLESKVICRYPPWCCWYVWLAQKYIKDPNHRHFNFIAALQNLDQIALFAPAAIEDLQDNGTVPLLVLTALPKRIIHFAQQPLLVLW